MREKLEINLGNFERKFMRYLKGVMADSRFNIYERNTVNPDSHFETLRRRSSNPGAQNQCGILSLLLNEGDCSALCLPVSKFSAWLAAATATISLKGFIVHVQQNYSA
jgi:hypothetical protein